MEGRCEEEEEEEEVVVVVYGDMNIAEMDERKRRCGKGVWWW